MAVTLAIHEPPELTAELPVLVFIHGMLASRHQWTGHFEALHPHAQPVCVELWGHGDSPAPEEPDQYAIQTIIGQIEQWRQSRRISRLIICGHSFGAGLAMRYVLTYPDKVSGLIFMNSLSALSEPTLFTDNPTRKARMEALLTGGVEALRRLPFHPRHALRLDADLRARLVREADRVDPIAVVKLNLLTGPSLSALSELDQIECPTLLVNGRFEKRFQPMRERALAEIRHCEVVDLDAGHAVNLEQPVAFNHAVTQFVQNLDMTKGDTN
ncbi:MAG: alpha/beta fold hydrolase [Burkholderiaceae bacterium]